MHVLHPAFKIGGLKMEEAFQIGYHEGSKGILHILLELERRGGIC